jgi:opacity protein-like surface antigen
MAFTEMGSRWHLMPELTFWKDSDHASDFAVNANVFYHFQDQGRTTPYLGFRVNLNFFTIDVPGEDESETELGINLLGGMLLPVSSGVTAFVEGRYVATELDQIMLLGGVTFSLSSGAAEEEY